MTIYKTIQARIEKAPDPMSAQPFYPPATWVPPRQPTRGQLQWLLLKMGDE